jgi:hypothetical protein
VLTDLTERARGVGRSALRATPVPLGVRCGVFLAGLVAVVLAYPAIVLFSRWGMLLLLVPLLPAAMPRGRAPTLLALLAVAGWLAATSAGAAPVALWRLLALAGSLYLLHSLAALAAVLPYDAVVPLEVAARWLGRALGVVLAAAVLAVAALGAVSRTGDRAVLAASLLGLGLAVAVAVLPVWLWRRAGSPPGDVR